MESRGGNWLDDPWLRSNQRLLYVYSLHSRCKYQIMWTTDHQSLETSSIRRLFETHWVITMIIVKLLIGQSEFAFRQRYVSILDRYFKERVNAKSHLGGISFSMTRSCRVWFKPLTWTIGRFSSSDHWWFELDSKMFQPPVEWDNQLIILIQSSIINCIIIDANEQREAQ